MVSQFISSHPVRLLPDLDFDFPEGTHAIGRLDINSEGLLLLTTNKKVTRLLFSGSKKHKRSYLVMVNNIVTEENIGRLNTGVPITIDGGKTYIASAEASLVEEPMRLFLDATTPPFGNHSWILITLTEGKFRQVRKMIAAIRHRCKRLIRISIGDINVHGLQPGEVKELSEHEFFAGLNIEPC